MKSLTRIIREEDFLKLAQEHSQRFLKIHNFLHGEHKEYTRRFYAYLTEESEELESFLDDHCARDNKTWYCFGELVASIRNFGKVAFTSKHILNRYPTYNLEDEAGEFLTQAQNVLAFFDMSILSLFEEIKKESLRLGIRFPKGTLKEDSFREIYPKRRLPYTIDEEEVSDGQKIVAKLATQYLSVVKKFEYFGWNCGRCHLKNLRNLVPSKIDEEKSRELMALVHNLQSTYDHFIKHTPLESNDERLKRLRGYISIFLHLLSLINWLSHFYQRHTNKTRRDETKHKISAIIDESKILDIIVNFALFYVNSYLEKGKQLVTDLLGKYTEVDTYELNVPEKLGFHLRPASLVAKLASYYGTKVSLIVDGQEYDASSVLSITMAAGLIARKGYKTVLFRGDKRVLDDLKLLSEYNYGEDERGNRTTLPPELSYLWP